MKRLIIASCVATLLTLVVTGSATFTGVRAEKTNKYQPFGAPGDFVRGRVLVTFRDDIGTDHARQIIAALGARDADEIPHIGVHILDLPYQASETAFAQSFQARPEVEFAELDRRVPLQQMEPNDPVYSVSANSWSFHKINAPAAWALDTGSNNITIAILDTGVDANHEDLVLKVVPGWNIYDNDSDTSDVNGHGTGVAGVAGASSNNAMGVASVAWACRIMPIRISDPSGYASYSAMASGLTWAADHGARVANISYNVTGSSTVSSAAKYFHSKGGVVATAAGNNGTCVQTNDDPYILTIGATDSSDLLYSWSNSGKNIDLVAPGNASTPLNGGGYAGGGGTSIASPFVAGAAALVLSANPNLTPGQVQDMLKMSADDLGVAGLDSTYGYGRLNLERAVTMAFGSVGTSDTTPPTISITSPGQGNTVSSSVTVTESTADNVGVVKVELYVDGAKYASSTTAPFSIKWSSRKAARGAHTLQSKAYDAVGNAGASSEVTVYK
jgi:subtilisin family serine protease